jgi:hypothetical protein
MARSRENEFGGAPLPELLCTQEELPAKEAQNLIRLADYVGELAEQWRGSYHFTPDIIRRCNLLTMDGIYADAGEYRTRFVYAGDFTDAPRHAEIPQLVEQMCEYVNGRHSDPFHASAYILWRTSWIHPFYDGNGRVSRELCFLAILVGLDLEGVDIVPIPGFLQRETARYMHGLKEADKPKDDENRRVVLLEDLLCKWAEESSPTDTDGPGKQ